MLEELIFYATIFFASFFELILQCQFLKWPIDYA
jgi:hypothetical protein